MTFQLATKIKDIINREDYPVRLLENIGKEKITYTSEKENTKPKKTPRKSLGRLVDIPQEVVSQLPRIRPVYYMWEEVSLAEYASGSLQASKARLR